MLCASRDFKNYEPAYFNNNVSGEYAKDNGTIVNNLSGLRNVVVEAEWKASARQGGSASVTYEVQKEVKNADGTSSWVTVPTPKINAQGEIELDGNGNEILLPNITVSNFTAETMSQIVRFGPIPQFDELTGKEINYRIVQTNVYRKDDNKEQNYTEHIFQDTTSPITINDDNYNITVRELDPVTTKKVDTYQFIYQLTGEIEYNIKKLWDDSAYPATETNPYPTLQSDKINATVEYMDFDSNEFTRYHNGSTSEFNQVAVGDEQYWCVTLIKDDELSTDSTHHTMTWQKTIHVPLYDDEGHEYQYRVKEEELLNPTYDRYVKWVTYDKDTNTYQIKNTYTPPGGPSLDFGKEWQDDGDDLHRKPVHVYYSNNVGRTGNGQNVQSTDGTAIMQESTTWKARISRLQGYAYDPDDFIEYDTDKEEDYTNVSDISGGTNNRYKWIYNIATTRNYSGASSLEQLIDENIVGFDNLTGVLKLGEHYYAVEQRIKGGRSDNGEIVDPSELEFVNTRIGVVNSLSTT